MSLPEFAFQINKRISVLAFYREFYPYQQPHFRGENAERAQSRWVCAHTWPHPEHQEPPPTHRQGPGAQTQGEGEELWNSSQALGAKSKRRQGTLWMARAPSHSWARAPKASGRGNSCGLQAEWRLSSAIALFYKMEIVLRNKGLLFKNITKLSHCRTGSRTCLMPASGRQLGGCADSSGDGLWRPFREPSVDFSAPAVSLSLAWLPRE